MAQQPVRRSTKRLLILDQNLIRAGGHYAEYSLAVARAGRRLNLAVEILANRRCDLSAGSDIRIWPVFRNTWISAQSSQEVYPLNLMASFEPWTFFADMQTGLDMVSATSADHLFIHTIGFSEVEQILRLLMFRPAEQCPLIHLLLRRDPVEAEESHVQGDVFYRSLRAMEHFGFVGRRIRFYTDTNELTADYSRITGLPFTTLPIPFDQTIMEEKLVEAGKRAPDARVTVGYLGDARPEKGYQFLPGLVDALAEKYLDTGKVRFVFQSNFNLPGGEPGIAPARALLDRYGQAQVELLVDPLDQEEYYQKLAEIDILVVPYLAHRYACRSSGIFTQAVAAGRVAIVPAGTSMANALATLPDEAGLTYESVEELAAQTAKAIETIAARREVLAKSRHAWCDTHAAEALVQALLAPPRTTTKTAPLVLILLDADSLLAQSGAGAVQSNQLAYFRAAGFRTAAVCMLRTYPMSHQYPRLLEGVSEIWKRHGLGFAWMVHQAAPFKEGESGIANEIARNSNLSVPDSLLAMCRQGVFDAVFVNYVTAVPYLDMLGLPPGVPIAIETHDVQSVQHAMSRNDLVDPEEYASEIALLKRTNAIIALNPVEGRRLRADLPEHEVFTIIPGNFEPPAASFDLAGLQDLGELVSSSVSDLDMVDFGRSSATGETQQIRALQQSSAIDLLYVSSIHPPNMRGFDWFFEKVFVPFLQPAGVTLLVVGTYSKTDEMRQRASRFPSQIFLAGRVEALRPLYAAARMVITPVFDGAGINIKVIEGLCAGKPVVATSYALRGLSGVEQIPHMDDPKEWANYILALRADPALRRKAAAMSLAAAGERRSRRRYFGLMDSVFASMLGKHAPSAVAAMPEDEGLPNTFIEWDAERVEPCNRLLRRLLEERVLDPIQAERVARLTSEPVGAGNFEAMAYAMLVDQTAPIYRTQRYVGQSLVGMGAKFESAQEAVWSMVLRATDRTRLQPASLAALAGCQNLAEVLSACGSSADFVDIEMAYATESLEIQFNRAVLAERMECAILCCDATGRVSPGTLRSVQKFIRTVHEPLLEPLGYRLVLIGDVPASIAAGPGILVTGPVASPAPVLSAANVVILPFDEESRWDMSAIQARLMAIAAGKPLVGWEGEAKGIPDVSGWVEEATDAPDMASKLIGLMSSRSERLAAARRSAAAFAAFFARSRPDEVAFPAEPELVGPGEPLEWTGKLGDFARVLNHVARNEALAPDAMDAFLANWRAQSLAETAQQLIEAVCIRQDSHIQKTSYLAFKGNAPQALAAISSPAGLMQVAETLKRPAAA